MRLCDHVTLPLRRGARSQFLCPAQWPSSCSEGRRNTMKHKKLLAALGGSAILAASFVGVAVASPATVFMHASGCNGEGDSWLSYPGGYTKTIKDCGSGYLSGSVGFSGGGGDTHTGTWSSFDQYWGNTGTGVGGPVGAAAATHALQYLTSFDGYYGTNTW